MTKIVVCRMYVIIMKELMRNEIELLWRSCEYIALSGRNEWRFDEYGHPVRYGDYLQKDKEGGWFIEEDEQHNHHVYSYACLRTLL